MKNILALWAVPRSTSTAFERMMRERGDFGVHDEPFGQSFYYSQERCNNTRYPNIEPNSQYNFGPTLERLKQENKKQPIFIKDMGFHVIHIANQEFLSNFNNSFLIRHPDKTLPSFFNNWPDFTLEETGYAELYKLFEIAQQIGDKLPLVIDSDVLVKKTKATVRAYCNVIGIPFIEKALEWKAEPQPEINQWEGGWHNYVLSSQGFKEREKKDYIRIEDNEYLKKAYEFCLPYYEKLYEYRLVIE